MRFICPLARSSPQTAKDRPILLATHQQGVYVCTPTYGIN
jgi:hypothetical protein